MEKLESVFNGEAKPDVYVVKGKLPIQELSRRASDNGFQFFHVDGNIIKTGPDFLDSYEEVMGFPDSGKNWNAVLDRMRDLSSWWNPERGYILLYESIDSFARNDPTHFYVGVEVFYDVIEFWKEYYEDMLVYIVLNGDPSLLPNVKQLQI